MSFGERLWLLRRRAGLSIEALSHYSGVASGAISMIENDLRNPSLGTLRKLAAAFHLSISELLEGVE